MLSTGTAVLEMLVTRTDNSRSWAEPDPLDEVRGQLLEMVAESRRVDRTSHQLRVHGGQHPRLGERRLILMGELGLAKEFALLLRGVEDVNNETELTSVLPQFLDLPRQRGCGDSLEFSSLSGPYYRAGPCDEAHSLT